MKKFISKTTAFVVLAFSLAFGGVASAETIVVDSTSFPDDSLRKALQEISDHDESVYELDVDKTTSLSVSDQVKSLDGIEKLTNLESLDLYSYEGGDINLQLQKLTNVYVTTNTLTTFKITAPYVTHLSVSGKTSLQSIDISAVPGLTGLYISGEAVSSVAGLDKLTQLKNLSFSDVALTGFDASTMPLLESLYIYDTGMTSLDLSACTQLKSISCPNNAKLTSLKVPASVTSIECPSAGLTSIDVSACTNLEYLVASDNNISEIDVKNNSKLGYLGINGNTGIKSLDISKNTKLNGINIGYTGVKSLNTSKNTKLTSLYCYKTKISKLNLSKNKKLGVISFYGTKIKKLNLSKYKNMYTYYEAKKNTKIKLKNFINAGYTVEEKSNNIKYDSKKRVVTLSKKAKAGYYEYVNLKKGKKKFSVSVLVTK